MQGTGRKEPSVPPAGCSETSATRASLAKKREGPERAGASPKATLSPVLPWDRSNSKLCSPHHQQGRVWKKRAQKKEEGPGASQLGRGRSLVSLPLCSWRRPHPCIPPLLTASRRRGTTLPAGCARAVDGQRWGGWRRTQGLGQRRRRRWRRQLPGRFGVRRAAVVHVVPGEQRRLRGSRGAGE